MSISVTLSVLKPTVEQTGYQAGRLISSFLACHNTDSLGGGGVGGGVIPDVQSKKNQAGKSFNTKTR